MYDHVGLRFYASQQLAIGRRGGGDHLTDLYFGVFLLRLSVFPDRLIRDVARF